MSAPSGYHALDFVGFTDKGTYSPSANYMRNDLVHYGGNIMRCLIDNTTNVTPVVGANWELWVGASANLVERVIAPLENNPADVAYGVGRQIIYDDWLWEVIAPIAVGDALVDYAVDPTNANIKKSAPVETQLLAVKAEADATDNMIAPTETNASSSSAAYAVGDQLILNNVLYTVTTAITIGDALVSGTGGNIEASDSLTDQLGTKANDSALAPVAKTGAYSDLSGKPTLGTAAAKNSTNAVTQSSTDLVESGAVYSEVDSVKQALTNEAVTRSKVGAHNLLPITASTEYKNGVTFTVNSNGTISASGTAGEVNPSTNAYFEFSTGNSFGLNGSIYSFDGSNHRDGYILTDGVNASSSSYYTMIQADGTAYIVVIAGQTVNLTFKPMLCLDTDPSDEFTPYAMTNRELTEQVNGIIVEQIESDSVSVAANGSSQITASMTKNGFIPLGIVSVIGFGSDMYIIEYGLTSTLAFATVKNTASSQQTGKMKFKVLYKKS